MTQHQDDLLGIVTQLRAAVAAVDRPDEGMRGTAADAPKLRAASNADTHATLTRALLAAAAADESEHGDQLAEAASAVIRSISITPDAAAEVASAVAAGAVAALRARRGLRWLLAAMVRLAQHAECHPALLAAEAVPAIVAAWQASGGDKGLARDGKPLDLGAFADATAPEMRLDLVACIFLSFISESDAAADAAALVPPEAIGSFVTTLGERLALAPGPAEAEQQVSEGLFFGLPLYYRPRFMVQALANLAARSDSHCAAAWCTNLPTILRGLHDGELSNDAEDNIPYGSPDAVELARGLAASLLRWHSAHPDTASATAEDLAALRGLAHGPTEGRPGWTFHGSHGKVTLRGCSAVSDDVAYVSGSGGTVLRTANGGETWADASPGDEFAEFEFRDVVAIDADNVYLLSVGNGDSSRILRTHNAGAEWEQLFVNGEEAAFYNALKFWPDQRHGIAFSDCVGGCFRIIVTESYGEVWTVVPHSALPAALDGEGAFAASGKNIVVREGGSVWIGLGAAMGQARVLCSRDFGATWEVSETPIPSGPSAGIFSLDFTADGTHGVAVGGDYAEEDRAGANVAVTSDGGATWELVADAVGGFRSVVRKTAFASHPRKFPLVCPEPVLANDRSMRCQNETHKRGCSVQVQYIEIPEGSPSGDTASSAVFLALGPSGADVSDAASGGRRWTALQTPWRGLHTFSQAAGAARGFSAGAQGGIASLELARTFGGGESDMQPRL